MFLCRSCGRPRHAVLLAIVMLFYARSALAQTGPDTTGTYLRGYIYENEIENKVSGDADWAPLRKRLTKKYGKPGQEIAMRAEALDYLNHQRWEDFGKAAIPYIDAFGRHIALHELNNMAWSMFTNVNDPKILKAALGWSKIALQDTATITYLDTYANLLYKLGRKEEAISLEERAVRIAPENEKAEFRANLEKMKAGRPTWEPAARPPLDSSALDQWPGLGTAKISGDGKYIAYTIEHTGIKETAPITTLQDVRRTWKTEFADGKSEVFFSPDSRLAYVMLAGDSLAVYELGSDRTRYIPGVRSFEVNEIGLVYVLNASPSVVHLQMPGQPQRTLSDVDRYLTDLRLRSLIVVRHKTQAVSAVSMYDCRTGKLVDLWEGTDPEDLVLSHAADRVAFIGKRDGVRTVWIGDLSAKQATPLITCQALAGREPADKLSITNFSSNDGYLLVSLPAKEQPAREIPAAPANTTVIVWSYLDVRLKSEDKMRGVPAMPDQQLSINLATKKIVPLVTGNEAVFNQQGDWAIVRHDSGMGNPEEDDWNPESQSKLELLSLSDGKRRDLVSPPDPSLSRAGKFILYYDRKEADFFTYETATGKMVNISRGAARDRYSMPGQGKGEFSDFSPIGSFWLEDDSVLIVYGSTDIWRLDPKGIDPPRNMTNGYGIRHNVFFRPLRELSTFSFRKGEPLLLCGVDHTNHHTGFYMVRWASHQDPQVLTTGPYVYCYPSYPVVNGYNSLPMKAAHADVWLVRRMSESESPNLYITSDLRTFQRQTNVFPEKRYNWMTTELHSWRLPNGDSSSGILYKPQDFDPTKQYPIIFHYYLTFSYNLHAYINPEASIGPMNIPWYVSHGYLVFVPDIWFAPGQTGQSSSQAVISAASYMKTKPYVDSARMGLQGHSFGGYQTNYIVTQTDVFAAACSASGVSDIISFAGLLGSSGQSNHHMAAKGQIGMGVRLWDDVQRYIRNSPLFYLDKVTTPLLTMHTTEDGAVNFTQGLELFNGLRQFRKKVWMLVYAGENHVLWKKENALDYTRRQMEFFDFYLKGGAQPAWMK